MTNLSADTTQAYAATESPELQTSDFESQVNMEGFAKGRLRVDLANRFWIVSFFRDSELSVTH